ncbi:Uncharacterized protein DAT39_019679, partial [Clarias magur]
NVNRWAATDQSPPTPVEEKILKIYKIKMIQNLQKILLRSPHNIQNNESQPATVSFTMGRGRSLTSNTGQGEDPEDTKDPEDSEDSENAKDPEDSEDSENAKDPEDSEDSEKAKDPEDSEDSENAKDPEDLEDSENAKDPEDLEDPTDSVEEPQMLVKRRRRSIVTPPEFSLQETENERQPSTREEKNQDASPPSNTMTHHYTLPHTITDPKGEEKEK